MNDAQAWTAIAGLLTILGGFLALITRSLERTMNFGFAGVDARFNQVDARLDRLDVRLDRLEARVDGLDRDVSTLMRRQLGDS